MKTSFSETRAVKRAVVFEQLYRENNCSEQELLNAYQDIQVQIDAEIKTLQKKIKEIEKGYAIQDNYAKEMEVSRFRDIYAGI